MSINLFVQEKKLLSFSVAFWLRFNESITFTASPQVSSGHVTLMGLQDECQYFQKEYYVATHLD
jgi:hypothetical protein